LNDSNFDKISVILHLLSVRPHHEINICRGSKNWNFQENSSFCSLWKRKVRGACGQKV